MYTLLHPDAMHSCVSGEGVQFALASQHRIQGHCDLEALRRFLIPAATLSSEASLNVSLVRG